MPSMHYSTTQLTRGYNLIGLALTLMFVPISGHGYQCGNGNDSCSLSELASFLDRIKPRFETNDVVYDQIYSEEESTIVFIQRLKHRMSSAQREYVKEHGANKEANRDELCADKDLLPILKQGLRLKYIVKDIDGIGINTFTIDYNDCQ